MRKKRNPLLVIAVIGGGLIAILVAARITGAINVYRVASGANEPALEVSEQVFTTNFGKPKRYDFIAYYSTNNPNEPGKRTVWMHRLCGLPGDTIEIKKGILYVNGISKDDSINIKLLYTLPFDKYREVIDLFELNEDQISSNDSRKLTIAFLSNKQVKELRSKNIPCEREFMFNGAEEVQRYFKKPWTIDDFGPIKVPANHYFVMGDNRYMSADSRFHGFVPEKDFHSVLIGSH